MFPRLTINLETIHRPPAGLIDSPNQAEVLDRLQLILALLLLPPLLIGVLMACGFAIGGASVTAMVVFGQLASPLGERFARRRFGQALSALRRVWRAGRSEADASALAVRAERANAAFGRIQAVDRFFVPLSSYLAAAFFLIMTLTRWSPPVRPTVVAIVLWHAVALLLIAHLERALAATLEENDPSPRT